MSDDVGEEIKHVFGKEFVVLGQHRYEFLHLAYQFALLGEI